MLIGIHAVAAFRTQTTGVEVYVREILRSLVNLPEASSHRFVLYTNKRARLRLRSAAGKARQASEQASPPSPAVCGGQGETSKVSKVGEVRVLRAPFFWTQVRLSWEMARRPPDALFVPAQALPRILPRRIVVTVHGLEFERYPEGYSRNHRRYLRVVTRDAARRASRIIAVSEATKRDLVDFYDVETERITVVRHGVPFVPSPGERAQETRDKIQTPYFLYLGRMELKKNVDGIIRAFRAFGERRRDYRLILAGAPGFGFRKIQDACARSSVRDRIVLTGYVPDEERAALLRDAAALCFPSRAEGFGFPILEAQASGTPVITGTTTAMPEVAGADGALFVEPGDDDALASAMETVADDETLRERLVAAGRENVKRFSWEECARKTLDVLVGGMGDVAT